MLQACRFGHAAAARVLTCAAKARGCQPEVVDMLDGAGLAPLHSAAQWGHVEVKFLPRTCTVELHTQLPLHGKLMKVCVKYMQKPVCVQQSLALLS